jgi:hypothetical protein
MGTGLESGGKEAPWGLISFNKLLRLYSKKEGRGKLEKYMERSGALSARQEAGAVAARSLKIILVWFRKTT